MLICEGCHKKVTRRVTSPNRDGQKLCSNCQEEAYHNDFRDLCDSIMEGGAKNGRSKATGN